MTVIGRGTLPANYEDFRNSASSVMRLPTPEPQYWFAKMAMASRLSLAAMNAGQQTAQQFVSMAGGGAQLPPELDEMARAADAYPGAILAVDEFGKDAGDTLKFFRDLYEGGGYTRTARKLNTEESISTTGQAIKQEEVPVILEEFHGPANSSGDVRPYAIWNFDAKYRANKEALTSKVTRYLGRDYTKLLDTIIRDLFIGGDDAATNTTVSNLTFPSGITAAADFTSGGTSFVSLEQIFEARKSLSDREWSKFGNGRYICLVPSSFNTQMLTDPDYQELSKFHGDGRNQLFDYIGSVQDVDFFEVTTLAVYEDAGQDFKQINGSAVAASVTLNEALLFGPGCIGFGTAVNDQSGTVGPELRFADDTNYGTVAKVIWYAMHAFKRLDTRGIQRVVWQV